MFSACPKGGGGNNPKQVITYHKEGVLAGSLDTIRQFHGSFRIEDSYSPKGSLGLRILTLLRVA